MLIRIRENWEKHFSFFGRYQWGNGLKISFWGSKIACGGLSPLLTAFVLLPKCSKCRGIKLDSPLLTAFIPLLLYPLFKFYTPLPKKLLYPYFYTPNLAQMCQYFIPLPDLAQKAFIPLFYTLCVSIFYTPLADPRRLYRLRRDWSRFEPDFAKTNFRKDQNDSNFNRDHKNMFLCS